MICNNCNNEFTNIDGLKFCPYCGGEIEDHLDLEVEHISDEINNVESEDIVQADANKKKHEDTQPMPAITEDDIKKYNRDKFFAELKKTFMKMKVIIPIIALLVVIAGGVFAYTLFIVKPVDDARIKARLDGKDNNTS